MKIRFESQLSAERRTAVYGTIYIESSYSLRTVEYRNSLDLDFC